MARSDMSAVRNGGRGAGRIARGRDVVPKCLLAWPAAVGHMARVAGDQWLCGTSIAR